MSGCKSAAPCDRCACASSASAAAVSSARKGANSSRCRPTSSYFRSQSTTENPWGCSMALTLEEVRWVAHLARLELSSAELTMMAGQLTSIIDYFNQLQQVDTDNIEPLAHPLPIQNV